MQIQTSVTEFCKRAKTEAVVAITAELSTDMETPVSLYYKVVGDEIGFILESVDMNTNFGRFSFIGAEPFAKLTCYHNRIDIHENDAVSTILGEPMQAVKTYLQQFFTEEQRANLPLLGGGAVGYFSYETIGTIERVRGLKLDDAMVLGEFLLCRVLIVMDHLKHTSTLVYLTPIEQAVSSETLYQSALEKMYSINQQIKNTIQKQDQGCALGRKNFDLATQFGAGEAEFVQRVETAKEYIAAGDLFQIVLSEQFKCTIQKPPFYLYRRLRQINPSPYMFYMNFGKLKLVGASPEMLVKVSGDTVYTYPIAGTRPRGSTTEEDASLAKELQADTKECAEHAMLVDLGRNDIGRISIPGTVKVNKLMEIEKFSHVMHMVSEVAGKLEEKFTAMDALTACFPAGTVSGAPKVRAMEIIHELENVKRNTYAGSVGYIDFQGNMDMCIAIRTIRILGHEATIQTGAGVVADSIPQKEYREVLQKAKAMAQVLEEVEASDFIN